MSTDKTPDDALIESSRRGNLPAMRRALEEGANINARDGMGRTPLMCAAIIRNFPAVTFLLEQGANPLIRNNDGQTVLEWATPAYIAQQRDILGAALDGVNTEAGTDLSICLSALLSLLERADQTARENKIDCGRPTKEPLRIHRPLRFKK